MNVACVIINYNDSDRVIALCKKLDSFNYFSHIVVSDNKSRDEEISKLKASNIENDVIHICYNGSNLGFCAGTNVGFEYLDDKKCDYVFTINSDVDVTKETLEKIVIFLSSHKDYGAATCRMMEYGNEKSSYYFFPTVHDENMQSLGLRRIFKPKVKPNKAYEDYFDVDFVRGSLSCFNYAYLKEIDFFDENTFLYYFEAIVGEKFFERGYKEAVLTNCTYEHNHIYTKTKINLVKIGHQDRMHAFDTYFKVSKFNRLRLKICYGIGLFLRKVFGFK